MSAQTNLIAANQNRQMRIIVIPFIFTIVGFLGFNIGIIGEVDAKSLSNKDIINGIPEAKIKGFDENKYKNGIVEAEKWEQEKNDEENSLSAFDGNKISSNESLSEEQKKILIQNHALTPKTKEEILYDHSKRTTSILNDQTRAIQDIYKVQPETYEQRQNRDNIQKAKDLNNYALDLSRQSELMALNGSKINSTYVPNPNSVIQPVVPVENQSDIKPKPEIRVADNAVIATSLPSKIETESRIFNAFYGIKGEKKEMGKNQSGSNIRAVIHGDADKISVVNGSNIKIRLIQDIKVNGIFVPKNTLVTGTCTINGDRLYIGITTVKVGDELLPLRVKVVDIDGVDGVYIPNMQIKSQLNQALVRSTDAVNSPGFYFTPSNAPAGQQILGQIASQGVSSFIQTGKQILNQKASVSKVSIKANYQILLIPVQY
ncbi:hypothetical protein Emtol_0328 (plasmid) [Emticicia oligotrophica DSM 17448]|uniref:Conjugative transposon TraM C-terminal domain-containing protein n=1 Tax=Emticicia oligotrophica (strain DSM 17448 / CIP 109782 / MTCC 6937 / GPTSA100-15) TaxID=929562 RepID=A0ABM5N7U1_EMTOG|nr:conjugative transposon protein TraM [Emticicia oligotrophica]AFK05595.1 hypothetical protein Emtol_0328 [Emticicia oligotrophica DSM 17448]